MSTITKIENNKISFKENLLPKLAEKIKISFETLQEKYISDKFVYKVYKNQVLEIVFKVAEKK